MTAWKINLPVIVLNLLSIDSIDACLGAHALKLLSTPPKMPPTATNGRRNCLFLKLFDQGYYVAQRGFIGLKSILSGEELDAHVKALEDVIEQLKSLIVPAPKGV